MADYFQQLMGMMGNGFGLGRPNQQQYVAPYAPQYMPQVTAPTVQTQTLPSQVTAQVASPVANTFTPYTTESILNANWYKNNPLMQTMPLEQLQNGLNQGKYTVNQLNSVVGNAEHTKTLLGNIQNMNANQPAQWNSFEGAFGKNGWVAPAIQGISALSNIYFGYKGLKLAEKTANEQIALQRANYRNTAKAMNNQYRDQMSGRGYNGMSSSAMRALGRDYQNRKVQETY